MDTLITQPFQLLYPLALWLLAPVWILAFAWRSYGETAIRHQVTLIHPGISLLPASSDRKSQPHWYNWLLYVLALSCLVLALSRPQSLGKFVQLPPEGREFVLLVDTSQSMGVRDFRFEDQNVARIDVLKGIVSKFVQARKSDHFSLITFASEAATVVPMTYDQQLVTQQLSRLQLGVLGDDTAIGHALALAVKQVDEDKEFSPVLILFSDGENTSGELTPRDALILSQNVNARIYAIAITGEDEELPEAITEPGLRDITRHTNGRFYHASNSTALQKIINDVNSLEKTIKPILSEREVYEWYNWLLGIAALLLTVSRLLHLLRHST